MKANASTNTVQVTPASLRKAADIAERIATINAAHDERIAKLQAEFDALMGNEVVAGTSSKPKGTRTFSPEVRAKIAAGQKARWAERNAAKAAAATAAPAAPAAEPAPAHAVAAK